MGKKSWFSAVRKVISTSYLKEKKNKKSHNKTKSTKKTRHGNQMSLDTPLSPIKAPLTSPPIQEPIIDEPVFQQPENEPMGQDSIAIAMEEELTNITSQVKPEVNCVTCSLRKSEEAAIKIQKVYRGYVVRNGPNPLKAWRRLKMYMQNQSVKRQIESTLTSMQTMARVQSQVRTRKIRMAEVNEALQQQQLQKRLNKLKTTKSSEKSGWDLSPKSKEQVEECLRRKKEAAERREKVLAYSYTRQQTWRKILTKPSNHGSSDADCEWNWATKLDVVRPWETKRGSVGVVTKPVSRQSAPSKEVAKSTQSVNAYRPMSSSGSSSMSGKKRAPSMGVLVGSTKKRVAVAGSPSKKNTNTKRWV